MDEPRFAAPSVADQEAAPVPVAEPIPQKRWVALFETLLVCGVPTQAFIGAALQLGFGIAPLDNGDLSLRFFATLSLIDTVLVIVLIRFFLRASGERSRDVFLGTRPVRGEAVRGLALALPVLIAVSLIVLSLRALFPWMRTVESNPLVPLMNTPMRAAVFLIVVVVAGGVREELQRAFILHRFEQRLGGVTVGLAVFTVAFGALHIQQGLDVAIAVGLLGLTWGIVYVRRRSAVLPIVNHAGFNALQVVQGFIARSVGA